MYTPRTLLIFLLCCSSGAAQSRDTGNDFEVFLTPNAQIRLGVGTLRLQPDQAALTAEAIGRVLDIGTLAQLEAEIESAAATAAASASEAKRLEILAADDQNASRQALEAATAQAAADAARQQLALRRLALEWGPGLTELGAEQRRQLISEITTGQAALLRVDPMEPADSTAGAVRLRPDASSPPIATESLGMAAMTDPRMQTLGWLVLVRGGDAVDLRPGRVLAAEIESGEVRDGVILPRSALVRVDGFDWVYLRISDDEFLRRKVVGARMQSDGWFVSSGFKPGDDIVDSGAGSLLAVERGGEATDDDDD